MIKTKPMRLDTEKLYAGIKILPFLLMPIFCVIHLSGFVTLNLGAKVFSLAFINTIYSFFYVCAVYLWGFICSGKKSTKMVTFIMAGLSATSFFISYPDFGSSFNDMLFTGTAVLTLLYVTENAEYILESIKKYDRYITCTIFAFAIFSVILFVVLPSGPTDWGEGNFYFGHRYASACGLAIMLLWVKLANRPKYAYVYWAAMLGCYIICFWTGARVYLVANLGLIYGANYFFKKNNIDFIIKCVAVTLLALVVFYLSPRFNKVQTLNHAARYYISVDEEKGKEVNEAKMIVEGLGNGRISMWKNCINSYEKLPTFNKLLGSGNKYIYDNNWALSSHTDFLNILHFHGIVGLGVYLLAFIGGVAYFWRKNKLPIVLYIGFMGVWLFLATFNGYASYTANMMSLPYIIPLSFMCKRKNEEKS